MVLILLFSIVGNSQLPNRISIQTGLFHYYFDKTPIVNKNKTTNVGDLFNIFGGHLNESLGLQYERKISEKSFLSLEFMRTKAQYYLGSYEKFTSPFVLSRMIGIVNLHYTRKWNFEKNLFLSYGAGVNYIWGQETYFLENTTHQSGNVSPKFITSRRYDTGINLRCGIDYSPYEWLTLFTNIDFLGIITIYTRNTTYNDIKIPKYLKQNYGLKNAPTSFDLSLRFGVGINFGK